MTNILISDFITGLFVFLRIAGVIFIAPVFGHGSVPVLAKMFLAIVITYMLMFLVKDFQFNQEQGLLMLALTGAKELITGMIIGFAFNIVFWGISYGGMLTGQETGFGVAAMFNPSVEFENNIIGDFYYLIAMMVFLLINGHHFIIQALSSSLKIIPLGTYVISGNLATELAKYAGGVFIIAIKIAAPVLVSFFLVHVAMGVISRVIPQMQVFFVVLPLKMILGLMLMASAAPITIYIIRNLLIQYQEGLSYILTVMSR